MMNNPVQQMFTRRVWWTVSVLMFLIGGSAFAMSFRLLMESARTGGKIHIWEYLSFPLLLDGGILLFTLAALWFTLLGLRGRFVARVFVGVFTLLTMLFNYNHAPFQGRSLPFISIEWLNEPQLVAILAPVVYFLCVEFYVAMLHRRTGLTASFVRIQDIERQLNTCRSELNSLETQRAGLQTACADLETERETRQAELAELNKQTPFVMLGMEMAGVSQREIGERLDVSPATVNRVLKQARIAANGQVNIKSGT